MIINIGKSLSDAKRVTKSFTQSLLVNAQIKEDTSIIDPTFIIEAPATVDFNYLKVPTWGRSYYIRNITALPGSRLALSCHVDVLDSFASEIKACTAIIDKQAGTAMTSPYLDDGSYVIQSSRVIQSYNYPLSFNHQATILITAGGQ